MTREENIENLTRKIQNTVQPIFDQVLSLNTWAKIWADEEYGLGLGAIEELTDALAAIAIRYDDVALDAAAEWTAKMKIFCELELQGEMVSFNIAVQNGLIESIDIRTKTLSAALAEFDLAAEYAKRATRAARR